MYLASDASSVVTGVEMVLDGGISSHLGGVDYRDELFATMTQVAR